MKNSSALSLSISRKYFPDGILTLWMSSITHVIPSGDICTWRIFHYKWNIWSSIVLKSLSRRRFLVEAPKWTCCDSLSSEYLTKFTKVLCRSINTFEISDTKYHLPLRIIKFFSPNDYTSIEFSCWMNSLSLELQPALHSSWTFS